jgi:hypothetical protein
MKTEREMRKKNLFPWVAAMCLAAATSHVSAADLGDVCWLMDNSDLLRLSVTQTSNTTFTYTGLFNETGVAYAVIGHVALAGSVYVGTFSGSRTSVDKFKTGIFQLTLDPATLSGTAEGIRQSYDRATQLVNTDYRTRTLTKVACP